jgi:hypothetical protein
VYYPRESVTALCNALLFATGGLLEKENMFFFTPSWRIRAGVCEWAGPYVCDGVTVSVVVVVC